MPARASVPIALMTEPPLPSSIGFWLLRSTCSRAWTSTNSSPGRLGSGRRLISSMVTASECGTSWRTFSSAGSRISSASWRSVSSSVVCSSGYSGGPSGSRPISRSSSNSTWSPLTALTGTTSAAPSTSLLTATSCSNTCFLLAVSVLVTTTTTGALTSRNCRAMNASPVPTGWSAGMQNTITSTSDSVSRTTSLSRLPSRLLGLCSPGVSTSTICPPGRWTTPRMACRVVCGRLLTMPTFSPTSALVSVVLPALGRPTRATKPLRCGGCSGVLTRDSLPPRCDETAAAAPWAALCAAVGALEEYLAGYDDAAGRMFVRLDQAIRVAAPDLEVAIKYRLLSYTVEQDWRHWVCAVNATKNAICLRFLWGVLLDDPLGVLRPGTSTLMTWDMPRGTSVDTAAVASYVP